VSSVGAAYLALEIEQGSDFQLVVTVVGGPVSMAGYVGSMQIRASKSTTPALYDVPSGMITVDNANRQVVVSLPWTETKNFSWDGGLYDLVITSGDGVDAYRVVEGKVLVDHSVTRAA
jgi:hypothetical protein